MKRFNLVYVVALIVFAGACQKLSTEYDKKIKPEYIIAPGDPLLLKESIKLSSDTVYILRTSLQRNAGQSLNIEAGTIIKVEDKIAIDINPGATINANGTAERPIIFTSSSFNGTGGVVGSDGSGTHYWYGIRLNGNADIQPQSSSGTMKYVRIEFAGGDQNYTGTPSMLFNNVGAGTEISFIQVSYSFETSSFEFRGGNCNASNLFSYASAFYDFYLEAGYTGKLQFLYAYRHPFFPVPLLPTRLAGIFINGSKTNPTISNLSIVGPDLQKGISLAYTERDPSASVLIGGGAKFHMRNSLLAAFPKGGIHMSNGSSAASLNKGLSEFSHSIVHSSDSSRLFYLPAGVYPPFTSKDFKEFMLEPQFSNRVIAELSELKLNDLFNYSDKIPVAASGSPLLAGSNFFGNKFNDPFFSPVEFVGAVGNTNWLSGWTNLEPLKTAYNK